MHTKSNVDIPSPPRDVGAGCEGPANQTIHVQNVRADCLHDSIDGDAEPARDCPMRRSVY
jgi:hypothetical protein